MIIKINNRKTVLLLVVCLMSSGNTVVCFNKGSNMSMIDNNQGLNVDMYEDADDIVVAMDVPGITENNIKVSVKDNHLYVSGKREEKEEIKGKNYFHKEIKKGSFERVIALPYAVDASEMIKKLSNGVLTIILPKK